MAVDRALFSGVKIIFLSAVLGVLILSTFSYNKINDLIKSSEIVNHTNVVKFELEKSISLLKDAETGQRGFLISHDSSFLRPYYFAIANIQANLLYLDSLVIDNTEQRLNMRQLHSLIDNRLNYLKKVLDKKTPPKRIDLLYGKILMDKARSQVATMIALEEKLLAQRTKTMSKMIFITPLLYITLVIVSILILIIAYFKIIGELSRSKKLQYNLEQANQALEETKAQQIISDTAKRFELIADTMPQMIWTADAAGNLNYFSQSVYSYSGLTLEQINKDGWLQIVHPEERDENVRLWIQAITTGESFLFEHRFKKHDGEYRWQLSRAIAQRDDHGNVQMWVGTSTDIHDQKMFAVELERKVNERTKSLLLTTENLEKLNTELTQFNYVASHDLQEPLRKIQTFATRIIESEEKNFSSKGKEYFDRMQVAAARMQKLIIDLLAYSRANTVEKHYELTDLNEILLTVKELFKETLAQKHAHINASVLPTLKVIPFQIEQLFTNIISNSLKFAQSGVDLVINISYDKVAGTNINDDAAHKNKTYHHLQIADNGIGFEQEYSERIFKVFQRLHGKNQFEGTGIGLAIVKKVVDNHNGIIITNSALNKGATFHIYLPA